jgi:hypothetical protein
MLLETTQLRASPLDNHPVAQADTQISTMRGNHITFIKVPTYFAEHFVN